MVTIVVAFAAVPDAFSARCCRAPASPALAADPRWFVGGRARPDGAGRRAQLLAGRQPVRRRQLMNYAFNRLHLVGTYGAFGSVTRERYEVILEGTTATELTIGRTAEWREYEFKGKPGDPRRRPPQVAPLPPAARLADVVRRALAAATPSPGSAARRTTARRRSVPALRLLGRNPFPTSRRVWIRARYYHYRFTTRAERRATGAWWVRELAGDYLRPCHSRGAARDGGRRAGARGARGGWSAGAASASARTCGPATASSRRRPTACRSARFSSWARRLGRDHDARRRAVGTPAGTRRGC